MAYQVTAYNIDGEHLATLGQFGNVASARQAMLDHAGVADLPNEAPFYCPDIRVIEGWFVDRTEYLIELPV